MGDWTDEKAKGIQYPELVYWRIREWCRGALAIFTENTAQDQEIYYTFSREFFKSGF